MKNNLICLLSVVVFSVPTCIAQTQSPDTLYLKNGSLIKGTILEIVTDKAVRIMTADHEIFVFTMEEIEKITRWKLPDIVISNPIQQQSYQPEKDHDQSGVTLIGGAAMPLGVFKATSGEKAGFAKVGFVFGLDGNLVQTSMVSWMSTVMFAAHTMDAGAALKGTNISAENGSWTLIWALTGLKIFGNTATPHVGAFAFGQLGFVFATIPQIVLSTGTVQVTQHAASATAFAFGFGTGLSFRQFTLSVRYLTSQPEYEVTVDGLGITAKGNYKQPTSCVLISGGFTF